MSRSPDVAVVGGGIIGLASARALAARGMKVVLLEAGEAPGRQASWAAAGMLAPLSEVPLPGTFVEVCRHSRDLWRSYAPELAAESGCELDYDTSGALALPEDEGQLARLEAAAAAIGEPCSRIGGAAARTLMPGLSPSFEELLLLPGEHRVDNRAVCSALALVLGRQGVELRCGWQVAAIEAGPGGVLLRRANGETLAAGQAILAAGAWSGQIAGLPSLPVLPVLGQMIAIGKVDWPFTGCVRGADFYAVRRAGGQLLVGATVEEIGFTGRPSSSGLVALLEWFRDSFPGLMKRPMSGAWSGLRPATPGRLPLVGRLDRGVLVATAHFRNGILLAPWTAGLVAELALGREPATELDRQALALFAPATL